MKITPAISGLFSSLCLSVGFCRMANLFDPLRVALGDPQPNSAGCGPSVPTDLPCYYDLPGEGLPQR